MPSHPKINYLVEGVTDAAIAQALIRASGGIPGIERVSRGKARLAIDLPKFNAAATYYPWLAIRDLDNDASCAPALRLALLPSQSSLMCFRVAVREAEVWLMADRTAFAEALGVPLRRVAEDPEKLSDPKLTVVKLARDSKRRSVRYGLVPEEGAGIPIGPEYAAWIIDFAQNTWNPARAAKTGASPSLAKALSSLSRLVEMTKRSSINESS
ncbi:conserved hypothetical protein [Bradyrhizobium sp. STM 3809]|nr:conserved hypothetical protein [Bradyrhizobium sp. STM 3809]